MGKGGLSQLGSACAEASCLARKGGTKARCLPGLSEVPFGFHGSDFLSPELPVTLPPGPAATMISQSYPGPFSYSIAHSTPPPGNLIYSTDFISSGLKTCSYNCFLGHI